VMYMNDKMKSVVMNEKNLDVIRREAIENGMTPLWNACRNLVLNGTTSLQELMSLNIE